jgi:hypothetical protein
MHATFTFAAPSDASVTLRNASFKVVNTPVALEDLVPTNPALASMAPLPIVPLAIGRAVPAMSPVALGALAGFLLLLAFAWLRRSRRLL